MPTVNNLFKAKVFIRKASKSIPCGAGVYKMLAQYEEVLYIGKARNLQKRVLSYANVSNLSIRIQRMVLLIRKIDYITTELEANALLLEASLIKQIKPKYNILLRDDKTYPHILLRKDHRWSQLLKHRGKTNKKGLYYGPFASVGSVNTTLNILQKIFPLRTCSDNEFANRKRACIQYQIGRCSGPCVNYISQKDYNYIIKNAMGFLSGNNKSVYQSLKREMESASRNLKFREISLTGRT